MTATVDDTAEARRLRVALADALAEKGDLTDPAWRKVFEAVPRHLFVPAFFTGPGEPVTAADPDWLRTVYTDDVLVTQMTDGVATSSSTAPGLMLTMLHALDVTAGASVLEVATGTGYNAALLAERLGPAGRLTTIEVDPDLARTAEERLRACGYTPLVLAGDGRAGHPDGAPYDRLIATCGFHRLPYTWVEQVRPGGVIVTPLGSGTVRLDVGDGIASGSFLPTPSCFMGVRSAGETGTAPYPGDPETAGRRPTGLDPSAVSWTNAFPFLVSLVLPGVATSTDLDDDRRVTGCRLWTPDGSWARVDDGTVRQFGPRRLWDAVEAAHGWWEENGRPERERFGIVLDREGQRLWLDEPGHLVPDFT
ncbi:methyltransferase domain-containing protein [Streptomyces thermoalcalitolerans]|uniref:Protein-L-isoaspartate O-methyltransferase n=1 Tax=Streptomyces thermoalcalitolerans TaxID=65605 RepID=A0ABP3Z3L6_9ACTN